MVNFKINIYSSRGGVHGKFNCPIRSNSDEASSNQQQQTNENQTNNVDMTNLKHIDQKLIEIIQSEVSSYLQEIFLILVRYRLRYSSFFENVTF